MTFNQNSPESAQDLTTQIQETERILKDYYEKYETITGESYVQPVAKSQWNWTRLLTIGFAFISCMVYLLGIAKVGKDSSGLPELFFGVDVQYYLFLTFYFLLAVIIPQIHQLKGYQIMQLFLGFWCFHWLVYDWWWWAYELGLGVVYNTPEFWNDLFYSPLLIPNPPMWLFLVEAFLGTGIGFYTIFVPKSNRDIAPSFIYLYTVYMNASVGLVFGLTTPVILGIGITLILIAYGLAILSMKRNHVFEAIKQRYISKNRETKSSSSSQPWIDRILSFDAFKAPWSYVTIFCLITFHVITLILPGLGVLFALIPWYLIPILFLFRQSIYHNSWSAKKKRILFILIVVLIMLAFAFLFLIEELNIV